MTNKQINKNTWTQCKPTHYKSNRKASSGASACVSAVLRVGLGHFPHTQWRLPKFMTVGLRFAINFQTKCPAVSSGSLLQIYGLGLQRREHWAFHKAKPIYPLVKGMTCFTNPSSLIVCKSVLIPHSQYKVHEVNNGNQKEPKKREKFSGNKCTTVKESTFTDGQQEQKRDLLQTLLQSEGGTLWLGGKGKKKKTVIFILSLPVT